MSFGIFQFRRGTSTQWTSANPVLLSGEIGLETDTKQFKLGDGTTPWSSLAYGGIQGPPGTAATLSTEDIQDAASAMITSGVHDGISVLYTDSSNNLSINNTDKGSTAVANHEALVDPHPQYATIQSAVLTATQANNTTTEQTLTGHTFTIPPGKSANIV